MILIFFWFGKHMCHFLELDKPKENVQNLKHVKLDTVSYTSTCFNTYLFDTSDNQVELDASICIVLIIVHMYGMP